MTTEPTFSSWLRAVAHGYATETALIDDHFELNYGGLITQVEATGSALLDPAIRFPRRLACRRTADDRNNKPKRTVERDEAVARARTMASPRKT
jgi:hypothetical protein